MAIRAGRFLDSSVTAIVSDGLKMCLKLDWTGGGGIRTHESRICNPVPQNPNSCNGNDLGTLADGGAPACAPLVDLAQLAEVLRALSPEDWRQLVGMVQSEEVQANDK